jgi:NADPH:quinone reductase-like Zn-dependent oxidoreductase
MKAVRVKQWGGPEAAVTENIERPLVNPGQVLIRVKAASVNPIDWKIREGFLEGYISLPHTLGSDVAGDIEAVGEGVEGFQVGDQVFGMCALFGGAFAEFTKLPATQIARKPETLGYVEAAAVPHAAVTAWQTVAATELQPGQRLLIHGAAGGVGHFAVQFARLKGIHIIGTASAHNEAFLRELGIDEFIDYTATPFETVVHDVDAVLDTVGFDTTDRSFQVIKPNGVMVCIVTPPSEELAAQYHIRVKYFGADPTNGDLAEIARLIDAGQVKPHVSHVMRFDQIIEALQLSQANHVRGKLVLKIEQEET